MSWHRSGYRNPFLAGVFTLSLMTLVLQWPTTAFATTQRFVTSTASNEPTRGGTVTTSNANQSYFYVHADEIQAQGVFLQPTSIYGKLGVELQFSKLVLYGMQLVKNTSSTDGIEIQSSGPVLLNNVTIDAVGLGFSGVGLKLNVLLPNLVLTDVNLMATRLFTDDANIPDLSLHAIAQPIGVNTGNMVDLNQIPFSGTLALVSSELDSLLNGMDPAEGQQETNPTDPTKAQQKVNSTDPTKAQQKVNPTDPTKAQQKVNPTDPTEAQQKANPTDPTEAQRRSSTRG